MPASHKSEHHDRERVIFIGRKGQRILLPYLLRPADYYCFSPREGTLEEFGVNYSDFEKKFVTEVYAAGVRFDGAPYVMS